MELKAMNDNINKLEYDPKTHGIYLKKDFLPVSKHWYKTLIYFLSNNVCLNNKLLQDELDKSINMMKKYLKQYDND